MMLIVVVATNSSIATTYPRGIVLRQIEIGSEFVPPDQPATKTATLERRQMPRAAVGAELKQIGRLDQVLKSQLEK